MTGTLGDYVGGLVGYGTASTNINMSYAEGNITGYYSSIGGLVGRSYGGTVQKSWLKEMLRQLRLRVKVII